MICPIFTWGSEVWHRPLRYIDHHPRYLNMHKLKYQALRKITGAYHGSSHTLCAGIAAIEPLEWKLECCWMTSQSHGLLDRSVRETTTYEPSLRTTLQRASDDGTTAETFIGETPTTTWTAQYARQPDSAAQTRAPSVTETGMIQNQ